MISIIVPIYNGEQYIEECIQSVLQQDSPEWELLLVNDGSIDNTECICRKYLVDSRIKYYWKKNSGVQDSRWLGIENSSAPYITFLDADDLLHPSAIRILNMYIKDDIDIVSFQFQDFIGNCKISPITVSSELNIIGDKLLLLKKILSGKMLSSMCGGLYNRKLLTSNKNLICNGLKIGEDTMCNIEMIYKAAPNVMVLPYRLYYYRNNAMSVMHTFDQNKLDAVYDTIQYLQGFLNRTRTEKDLKCEAGFRYLLFWSTYVFHPDKKYYCNEDLRKRMKYFYFSAFRYLYPYLRVYLFIDFFICPLYKLKKLCV